MSGMFKSTIIVTALNGLGMVLSLLSQVLIAAKFGTGKEMDIYLAATTPPLFVTSILTNSLSFTFIPVFAEYRAKNISETWKIVSTFTNMSILITTVLTIIGIFFSHPIMKLLAPGFNDEKIDLSANLLCWLMPTIILTIINELMSSVYYSNNRFSIPLINKIINPALTIIYVLLFSASMSTKSLVFASLTAMFLQTLFLAIGFMRNKEFSYSFVFEYTHPGVLKIVKLMLPLIAGMIIYRALPLFDRFIASTLPEGSISFLGYSSKIYFLLASIITSGISLSVFPLMSKLMAENNQVSLRHVMSKGIRFLFFLSIPITLLFSIYSKNIIQLFFERGEFHSADTISTALALSIYLIALPIASAGTIVAQGYYILQDTITPVVIGILEMLVYIGLAYLLLPYLGFIAIPVSYVIYFYSSIVNAFIVRKKIGGTGGKGILISFLKHSLIACIVAAIIFLPVYFIPNLLMKNSIIALGLVLYCVFCKYFIKSEEANLVWEKFFINGLRKVLS